ncbi:MAG: hypothetical protein ACOC6C_02030, partial [Verrucomicrobiota bacterium]
AGLDNFIRIRIPYPKLAGVFGLIIFAAGLAMIGIAPDYLFPLLWVSPLFIITSFQAARGRKTIFSGIEKGRWKTICLIALSALVCGFFWELWNYRSAAKWIYLVPFVNRFKIFEMPLLGYAGYLPFGLECSVVAALFTRKDNPDTCEEAASEVASPSVFTSAVKYGNNLILVFLAVWFFIAPGFLVIRHLSDPALGNKDIPALTWSIHSDLTPRYGEWARKRVASGKAGSLGLYNVPDTEWPMFGSVYYLWATENLQAAWEKDNSLAEEEPRVYARETIEAAVNLIMDPVHHTWVRQHWGNDYMHDRNVFFRSLIIAGLTSHEKLIGNGEYTHVLKDQIDTLAAELDASRHGVLDDYPDECYPIDVLAAIACIQRADEALGTDHSRFIARSIRAFQGDMLDSLGLIPYRVDDWSGRFFGPSRGVGNSYALIFAPELWSETAREWYASYEEHFWQDKWWASGFREFPREIEPEFREYVNMRKWYDVDAGPIIGGFSPAANAFGLAAAKVNGRLDHAYTLGTQVIAATWPLPDGSLLGPRILSDSEHAPYLGEACVLYFLSERPHPSTDIVTGGSKPACVYLGLMFYFGTALTLVVFAYFRAKKWKKRRATTGIEHRKLQFAFWIFLLAAALAAGISGHTGWALMAILVAQFLPQTIARGKLNEAHNPGIE